MLLKQSIAYIKKLKVKHMLLFIAWVQRRV